MQKNTPFIGRRYELETLENLSCQKSNLIVVKGRRRIGKSRLIREFGRTKTFLEFSGLAPEGNMNGQTQRDHFANQCMQQFNQTPFTFNDWSHSLQYLSEKIEDKPTVVLFDEISWMGSHDSSFVSKLKDWWDKISHQKTNIQLILCGSVSTWIEENIINNTALFGRISLQLTLKELTLNESVQLLKERGFKGSSKDLLKIISVTGGIPWYLEQVNIEKFGDDNISQICFQPGGILSNEFERIFHDLYGKKSEIYKNVVNELSKGMKTQKELRENLEYQHGGYMGELLKNLEIAGFITRHHTWSFKSGKSGKQALFRLSDNYVRFFLRYVEPNLSNIQKGEFIKRSLSSLPGWSGMLGYQIESLLLNQRSILLENLGIRYEDIIADNPFIQRPTKQHKGCQVDYLIQTRSNTLILCEFKFRGTLISGEVISEIEEKIRRLSVPKGFGIAPVLVYHGRLSETLEDSAFFLKKLNIEDWL